MVRAFRIGILNFLRDNNAVTELIDIKTPFLANIDSEDKRRDFKHALDTLINEKLIVVNGSFEFLNWKRVNGLYPLDDKIIEAKITSKGLVYEHPAEIVQTEPEPEPPLDIPVPPAVTAIKKLFISNKDIIENRVRKKMKKLGAKDTHLEFKKSEPVSSHLYEHVSIVPNPLTDDSLNVNSSDDNETVPLITLHKKKNSKSKNGTFLNKLLSGALIVVSIILVILIVMVFKSNA